MKRFVMALTLACALSGTALAGNVPSTDYVPPPPPPPGAAQTASPGDIPSGDFTSPGDVPSTDFSGEVPTGGLSVWLTILDFAF